MAITTLSSTGAAAFTASGLASGMDTGSIIDQLVALEKQPIQTLQGQQAAMKTQVSSLGSIVSKLSALGAAADELGKNGVFANTVASTSAAWSATASTGATPGRYQVEVQAMARAAKWRSDGLASGQTMAGGVLALTVQGKTYDPISVADGASLADVAYAIRQSGAPISAAVLNDGTRSYLSITALDTGYPVDQDAASALQLSFTPTPALDSNGDPLPQTGVDPGFHQIDAAQNATVVVDGLTFTRQGNVVADAVPGVTLNLTKEAKGTTEDLVVSADQAATQQRIQTFVDAYNGVMSLVQKQLAVTKDTDRTTSLAGVGSVRALQQQLHDLLVSKVSGLTGVRTLSDLGLKSSKDDGSLSIDATRLQKVMSSDPAAVNALFTTTGTGLAGLVDDLVDRNTSTEGALTLSKTSLDRRVQDLDDQIARMNDRVDAYRQNLVARFAAMESTISSLKSMGSFLTNWSNQNSKSSS